MLPAVAPRFISKIFLPRPSTFAIAGLSAALLLGLPFSATAQAPRVFESPNAVAGGEFGAAVESVGDLNGDGAADVIVGAPGEDVGEEGGAGQAYVLSGADGTALRTLTAPTPESLGDFGRSIAATRLGGTPYVAVGSTGPFLGDHERVYLFDLSDGSDVQTLKPTSSAVIAMAGDLNDDGTPEVLVGRPDETVDGMDAAGRTYVYSGADGDTLRALSSPNAQTDGEFGASVASETDINGDGVPDLIVGAPEEDRDEDGTDGDGRAYLFDGASGDVLQTLNSQYDGDFGVGNFGAAVAPLADINADGTPDLIVGASTEDVIQEDPVHIFGAAGRVHLISGTDGTILKTLTAPPSTALGRAVAPIGDVNYDGIPDVIAGAPGTDLSTNQGGPVHVFSGAEGTELDSLASQSPGESTRFGREIADAGDADGDGVSDIIVGDRFVDINGDSDVGRVYVYSGARLSLVAKSTQSVSSNGTVPFESAGVALSLDGVSGSGEVTVERFGIGPNGSEGISESTVSEYRVTVEAGPNLSFNTGEVRFGVDSFGGIQAPTAVTVYSRSTVGEGSFSSLPTSVDENGTPDDPTDDEIVGTTDSFSEFVLASSSNTLPVELAGFDGKTIEEGVRLTWQTTSETGNAGFRVQRRIGGGANGQTGTWKQVGRVEGSGSTTTAQSYRFVDEDLPYAADVFTYRLKQVDTDGSATLSDATVVERGAVTEPQLLGTFPNPARGHATVRFAVPEGQNVILRMYDVLGRKVRTLAEGKLEGRQDHQVDLTSLTSGTYFLRLTAETETETQRLTVVR
jgi:hypothetical protein